MVRGELKGQWERKKWTVNGCRVAQTKMLACSTPSNARMKTLPYIRVALHIYTDERTPVWSQQLDGGWKRKEVKKKMLEVLLQ